MGPRQYVMLLHQIEKALLFPENSFTQALVNLGMDLGFAPPSDFAVYSVVPRALHEYSP